jgi:hypothetical protein
MGPESGPKFPRGVRFGIKEAMSPPKELSTEAQNKGRKTQNQKPPETGLPRTGIPDSGGGFDENFGAKAMPLVGCPIIEWRCWMV